MEKFFIKKRLQKIGQFISSICEIPELRSSIYFLNFVKVENPNEFGKTKELLNKRVSRISVIYPFSKK